MNKLEIRIPNWVTGYCGYCPKCGRDDTLIFITEMDGKYTHHCMLCGGEFDKVVKQ